jgi:hypothetical protein
VGTRRRTRWYRTPVGILLGGIVAVVALGLIIYAVVNARSNSAETSRRQSSLNQYTAEVRSLLQTIRAPVTEMLAVPLEGEQPLPDDFLTRAESWVEDLEAAAARAQGIAPASGQQEAQQLFSEAVTLYGDAAKTFSDAALVDPESQRPILLRAAAQVQHANNIRQVATRLLDSARSEAGLAPSLIGSPAEFSPGTQPSPQPSPPPTQDRGAGKDAKQDGGKGGGDKGGEQ